MSSIHSSAAILIGNSGKCRVRVAIAAAAILFAGQILAAQQAPAPQGTATGATNPVKKSPRHRTRPAQTQVPAVVEQPAPPPQPELPKWPVNEMPAKPTVTWDSSGLKIQANNSSLHDILNQVSTDTGAQVEGLGADERVFGEFGPGTARDVISQLLHGSSYNVLMIGDQGAGTPRQIVLSTRHSGNNPAQANRPVQQDQPDEDVPDQPDQSEDPASQQPPLVNRPPMPQQMVPQGPPGAPRTPQQVLQELQQRQQQLQDQQQQQQQPH